MEEKWELWIWFWSRKKTAEQFP